MKARLIAMTQPVIRHEQEARALTADELIAYCARVSNPGNQHNHETAPKLLAYCIRNGHWSVFEQAGFTAEVETSLSISLQIIRHWTLRPQQFSARYSEVSNLGDVVVPIRLRLKAEGGNRQGSGEDVSEDDPRQAKFQRSVDLAVRTYLELVADGIAPESARFVLPQCARTRLYLSGNIRSWIHYFDQRCSPHAQKEHRLLAEMIRDDIFRPNFPAVSAALEARQ